MRQGALKVTAKINAKAAEGVSEESNTVLKPVATSPPLSTATENKFPPPKNNEPKTPKAASLLTMDATYAKNVCHVKPNTIVTGSMARPKCYNSVPSGLPEVL